MFVTDLRSRVLPEVGQILVDYLRMRMIVRWLFNSAVLRLRMQNSMCSGVPGCEMPFIGAAAVVSTPNGFGGSLAAIMVFTGWCEWDYL